MGRPYSDDLRQRVAGLLARGYRCREVAELCEISVATAVRIGQRHRQTGSASAKPMGGVRRDALGAHRDWLRKRLAAKPDVTLAALQAELAQRGLRVSIWTVWKFCRDEKLTNKKKPAAQRAGPSGDRPAPCLLAEGDATPADVAPGVR